MRIHLLLVAIFGVAIPYWKGLDFFDPAITAAYACIGPLFSAPASAHSFGTTRPQTMRDVCARAGRAAAYGEGLAILFLLSGTATVAVTHGFRLLLPDLDVVAIAGLLGLTATIATSGLTAWVTLRYSPAIARLAMRVFFFGLLIAFLYNARRLMDVAWTGSAWCAAAAVLAVLLLRRELR